MSRLFRDIQQFETMGKVMNKYYPEMGLFTRDDGTDEVLCLIMEAKTHEVVTIGCFATPADASVWAHDCIARQAWLDGSELPDLYTPVH